MIDLHLPGLVQVQQPLVVHIILLLPRQEINIICLMAHGTRGPYPWCRRQLSCSTEVAKVIS